MITGLSQGGAEAMLEKLVLTGRRVNPEFGQEVVSLGRPGVVGERLAGAGVSVTSLELGASPRALWRLPGLTRRLRSGPATVVVQTWMWHADLVGGLCALAAGNRQVVWNVRNSMPRHSATKPASRVVARLCGALSSWVPARIVCNSVAALRAHEAVGYRAAKCVVIPNGFDLKVFAHSDAARDAVRARWNAQPADVIVGMVARVDPLKDHATFIRAAVQVAAHVPHARFVLVGDGVTADESIRSLLARSGVGERFVLEERTADVAGIMSALDIFCLASRSEGFPNVLGEAMACATPSVATDVGDVRDILRDEHLVAAIGDPASLASRIIWVAELGEDGRQALGVRQRAEIVRRFDIERVWGEYLALYTSL